MTPLQQAAQELLAKHTIDSTAIPCYMFGELRKALEAEQAQALGPVAWMYDWHAEEDGVVITNWFASDYDEAHSPTMGCHNIRPLYLHPSPPPAGEQIDWQDMYLKQKSEKEAMAAKYEKDIGPLARVSPAMHLSEILAEKGITLQKAFVEKPRDHVGDATAMVGERAELIAGIKHELAEFAHNKTLETLLLDSVDMLEADAREIALYAGTLESRDRNLETMREENVRLAQQVAVPPGWVMVPTKPTFEQIMAAAKAAKNYMNECGANSPSVIYKAMLAAAPQPPQGDKQ